MGAQTATSAARWSGARGSATARRRIHDLGRWLLALSLALPGLALPVAGQVDLGSQAQRDAGKELYGRYCSQCHGDEGDGQGVAARYLKPAPRDFTSGKYKIRTTPTGSLPTDDDLHRVIRRGLPFTSMPAFGHLSDGEVTNLIYYLKSFSEDFADPAAYQDPITIPAPPAYTEESVAAGEKVFAETGCARCHGELGRGDGMSAPTLKDDWGRHIRVADLTQPWTFRGGGSRQDIYRTMSTGFNGTPMPGFEGAMTVEDRWRLVDYIASLSGNVEEAPYANLVRAVPVREPLDLERAEELFAQAEPALFPVIAQVMQPGRDFYPSATSVKVEAIYNRDEIALRVSWHDMRPETRGVNGPAMEANLWEVEQYLFGGAPSEEEGQGEEEGGSFWGDEDTEGSASDEEGGFWGEEVQQGGGEEASGDFWGEESGTEEGSGGDFWGSGEEAASEEPIGPDNEYSDAVAVQFPRKMPTGIRRPYFLFGDSQIPVELWYSSMDQKVGKIFEARGSTQVSEVEGDPLEVVAGYDKGEWSVVFKRKRSSIAGITFEPATFVPVAFSVWDGFNRERGKRRGITSWFDLYMVPLESPSPLGPMAKAVLAILLAEILLIVLVRRKVQKSAGTSGTPGQEAPPQAAPASGSGAVH